MSELDFQYPPLPPSLSGRLNWRILKYFGAGAIIASVTIGSGETLFASRGGAIFEYALLWCFVGGTIMKGIQVYGAARYMTLTGEHPMAHWVYLPGPRAWFPVLIGLISLACFPFWLAGLPLMIGKTVNWIFSVSPENVHYVQYARFWGTLCILLAVILTWVQRYGVLERVQTFIVGLLIVFILAAFFASGPDWLAALLGTFVPQIPQYDAWMLVSENEAIRKIVDKPTWIEVGLYLGAIGGGTNDYIGYLGCYREKAWGALGRLLPQKSNGHGQNSPLVQLATPLPIDTSPENVRRGLLWLRPPMIDVGVGFLCVLVFTICFVVLGAEILHPQELVPSGHDLLTHQVQFLTQFHSSLKYVYQAGIFMAFWGTIYGAYEIYVRTAYEFIAAITPTASRPQLKSVRTIVLLYCAIGGLALLWTFEKPVDLIKPAAYVGGVFACGLWCFAMIWTDRRFLPQPLRMGWLLCWLTAVSGLVLTAVGALAMWDYLASG